MKKTCPSRRRGAGIAAAVLLLVVLNIAVVGAVSATGQDAQLQLLRLETARAFYAAEAGALVVARSAAGGLPLPVQGAEIDLGTGVARFVRVPPAGQPGDAEVEGRSGGGGAAGAGDVGGALLDAAQVTDMPGRYRMRGIAAARRSCHGRASV